MELDLAVIDPCPACKKPTRRMGGVVISGSGLDGKKSGPWFCSMCIAARLRAALKPYMKEGCMSLTAKDQQIAFLNATNAAATFLSGKAQVVDFDIKEFESVRDEIYSSFLARCHEFTDAPLGVVPDDEPIASVTQVPTELNEAALAAAAPPVGLAPLPDATQATDGGKDAQWKHLFANPSDYFDNRDNKRNGVGNPRQPDFKQKSGAKVALWINSKDTPQWVKDQLGG